MIAQCKLPRYHVIPHRTGPVGDDLFISAARLESLGAEQYIVKRALAYDGRVFYRNAAEEARKRGMYRKRSSMKNFSARSCPQ
jgi:5-hydroxyisourate hydrolase-like protein (transthyretin family)